MDQFWNQNAQAWEKVIDSAGIPSRAVTNQAILEQIFLLNPSSILDLGCGEGLMSAPLRERGLFYRGLDGSGTLIKLARQKHGEHFEAVSYADLGRWQAPRLFDVGLFNFSLFDDDRALGALFLSVKALLVPRGRLLIQTLHPCFAMSPYRSGWNTEDFKSMSVPFSGTMRWYGRTLSDWQNLFSETGWLVTKLTEPLYEGKPASLIFELSPT